MDRPFERWAGYYDTLYEARGRNVAAEVAVLERLIGDAKRLLDVGCGTGAHLRLLSQRHSCVGLDASPSMLACARAAVPRARLFQCDIREFDLGEAFDAVVCLFGTINYVPELEVAIERIAAHLKPEGVALIEPAVLAEDLQPAGVSEMDVHVESARIWRRTSAQLDDQTLSIRFDFEIDRDGTCVAFDEVHRITVASIDRYEAAFASVGVSGRLERCTTFPRGLFVVRRQLGAGPLPPCP